MAVVVEILLKATGNAPILKIKKWKVEKEKTVAAIGDFVRKLLKLESSDSLVNIKNSNCINCFNKTLYDT